MARAGYPRRGDHRLRDGAMSPVPERHGAAVAALARLPWRPAGLASQAPASPGSAGRSARRAGDVSAVELAAGGPWTPTTTSIPALSRGRALSGDPGSGSIMPITTRRIPAREDSVRARGRPAVVAARLEVDVERGALGAAGELAERVDLGGPSRRARGTPRRGAPRPARRPRRPSGSVRCAPRRAPRDRGRAPSSERRARSCRPRGTAVQQRAERLPGRGIVTASRASIADDRGRGSGRRRARPLVDPRSPRRLRHAPARPGAPSPPRSRCRRPRAALGDARVTKAARRRRPRTRRDELRCTPPIRGGASAGRFRSLERRPWRPPEQKPPPQRA